ncbi:NAD(P)H dehydrogenase [Nostoc sp. 3335mG]|nr:NAD(P)H dehydrogenase [Nostoc sp. 3335mG]
MHALIIVSHPLATSLTHATARAIADAIGEHGGSSELADISAEGFDPRWSPSDVAAFLKEAPQTPEILAEQARIDRADALVLVYPIYWWSFPALLKGWIDRVFANGWAYDERDDGSIERKLGHLPVHLAALGGADLRTYARHGYFGAMRTQIDHGIFDYCGAPVIQTELLVDSDPEVTLETARKIGRRVVLGK